MDLFTHFEDIDDPRIERTKKHKLFDIIVLSICAVIANADTFVEIERYGKAKYDWLKKFLELPHGIPSHDTIGRVFSLLDPQVFYDRFQQWITDIVELVNGEIIAIDAMGAQKEIAKQITQAEADYVLALKGNQGLFHEDVQLYLEDAAARDFQGIPHDYTKTVTKDHGRVEVREYWITNEVTWLPNKEDWKNLTCIENTTETEEIRYFITSLPPIAAKSG